VSAPVRFAAEDLELLAERVAELVLERMSDTATPGSSVELVDAAEIAQRFGLTAATVRARADTFGAIRVGDGPKPRLRFDSELVAAALASGSTDRRSPDPEVPAQPPFGAVGARPAPAQRPIYCPHEARDARSERVHS